jgi:hypothetical protein
MWHGEALYGLGVQGFGVLFLLLFFFFIFAKCGSSRKVFCLVFLSYPSTFGAGSQRPSGPVGQQAGWQVMNWGVCGVAGGWWPGGLAAGGLVGCHPGGSGRWPGGEIL